MTDQLAAVRRAAQRLDQDRDALHKAIKSAAATGFTLRRIADAAQVSHQTIANIIGKKPS